MANGPDRENCSNWPSAWAKRSATAHNAAALWALADRLAQAEGEFSPFDRSGPFAIAYGPAENAQS
jgi:hypothetical protein